MEKQEMPEETFQQLREAWEDASAKKDEESKADVKAVYGALAKQGFDAPSSVESREWLRHLAGLGMKAIDTGSAALRLGVAKMIPKYSKLVGAEELKTLNPLDPRPTLTAREATERVDGPINPLTEASLADVPGMTKFIEPGGPWDVTARGAGALAVDTLLSPGLGAGLLKSVAPKLLSSAVKHVPEKIAGKAAFAADPFVQTAKLVSKAAYRGNFKGADIVARQQGKRLLSDVMYKHGFRGTAEDAISAGKSISSSLSEKTGAMIDDVIAKIAKKGTQAEHAVPAANVFGEALGDLNKLQMSKIPATKEAAELAEKELSKGLFSNLPGAVPLPGANERLGLLQLKELKRHAQLEAVGEKAYDALGNQTILGKSYAKIARTADKEIERILDKVQKGLGSRYDDLNQDISSILTTRKALASTAKAQASASAGKQIVGGLLGAGLGAGAATLPMLSSTFRTSLPYWALAPLGTAAGVAAGTALTSPALLSRAGYYGQKLGPSLWSGLRAGTLESAGQWARERTPEERFMYEMGK